jgi:putative transposase
MLNSGYKIRNPEGIYFVSFATVEWVDVFTRNQYAGMVVESLQYCIAQKGLRLHAWCLMSNHLHLILSAQEGFSVSDLLRDFKKYTSARIIKAIEENKQESRRD